MLFTSLDDMSKYNDEELLAYHALTDLKRIVVGPFWQWFRYFHSIPYLILVYTNPPLPILQD